MPLSKKKAFIWDIDGTRTSKEPCFHGYTVGSPPVPESWETDFDEKCKESFAKGGFLTTDLTTDAMKWIIDPNAVKSFIARVRNQALEEAEGAIRGQIGLHGADLGIYNEGIYRAIATIRSLKK